MLFLEETAMRYKLKQDIFKFREKIIYIQKAFRAKKILAKVKMDIIQGMWTKELNQMQMKSIQVKDRKNKEIIKDLQNIKEDIKMALINKYME